LLVKIASLPGRLFERKALGPATVGLILALASAVSIEYISLYAAAGIRTEPYFTAQAVGMFLTRIGTVRFSDRHPLKIIMPAAAAGAAFLLIAFTSGAGLFFTAGFLYGLCLGVTIPLLNAAALKSAPPERYGAASSTYSLFFDLAIGVGSLLWGKVVDISHSYTPVFAGGAFFILLGGGLSPTSCSGIRSRPKSVLN
jgi:predicted MFS family arabinose efflux permease